MNNLAKILCLTLLGMSLVARPVWAAEFGVFGSATYFASDESDANNSFAVGALDFFGTMAISDNTRVFVEYVFEHGDDGLITDLERLWVARTIDDAFTIAAGRFHTPLGYWNRHYHHGDLIQDTITRPFFLDFEDGAAGVLPVHVVGLMATGDIAVGNSEIGYEFSIANGPSIDTAGDGLDATPDSKPEIEINDVEDPNEDKSVTLRAVYRPNSLPAQIGIFGMHNVVAESADTGGVGLTTSRGDDLVTQNIFGLDFLYSSGPFELLAEYYYFDNDNDVSGTSSSGLVITEDNHDATAWYGQFSYQLTERFKAIYRHASLSFDEDDVYFRLLGTQEAKHDVFGLRYDLDETNALKFEIDSADVDGGEDHITYALQWAFLIP